MTKKTIGIFVIAIGVLLLLDNLKILSIDNMWGIMFSLGLFTVGLVGTIEKKRFDFMLSAFMIIGILYYLSNVGLIDNHTIHLILWPLFVIAIGLSLLFGINKKFIDTKDKTAYTAIFSGTEHKNASKEYISSEITALFGGVEADYRKIKIKGNKGYINVTAIFGGATIFVPEDIKLTLKGMPIFGGAENKATTNENSDKELVINYTVIFGGIEIKS